MHRHMILLSRVAGLGLLAMLVAFLTAGVIGGLLPVNSGWHEASTGTAIHIASSPIHSALVVPVSAEGEDLSLTFRPTDLGDSDQSGQYLVIGWGDRDFYRNTPTWSDLTPATLATALMGSGASVVHVDHIDRIEDAGRVRTVRLSRAEYRRLIAAIRASLAIGSDGHPVAEPGYGARDVFYASGLSYSAFNTCNVWTGDMLATAGIRVGRWSPLPWGVTRWFPVASARTDI